MGEQYPRKERIKLNTVIRKQKYVKGGYKMNKNHQYISQKRRNYDTRMNQKTGKRFCFKQTSQKENTTVNDSEAINQSAKMVKLRLTSDFHCDMTVIVLLITIVLAVIFFSIKLTQGTEDKADNVISRHYTEIMKDMDKEPKDISLYKYQANIPKIVQKDIDKMLEMGEEDANIVYHNDAGQKITIEPSEESESGYKVRFERATNERYDDLEVEELKNNVSFYKTKDTLVIYGGYIGRMLSRYHMDNEEIGRDLLDNKYVDLYGTNVKYDDIREFNSYFTLIRKDTEFSFYHWGNKLYTTNFEGGEISDWSYFYLTTTSKDCYNVYYSENPQDHWIKFYKVAENVDKVLEDEKITVMDEEGSEMNFPIFKIGNKKFAQIPNPIAEKSYGQNHGRNYGSRENKINFISELVEISASNSSKVEMKYSHVPISEDIEWRLNYYFQVGDRQCFFRKRINGLDSGVAKLIPEERIKKFDGKVISPDEVEKYINQLRLLYDEYTNNKF